MLWLSIVLLLEKAYRITFVMRRWNRGRQYLVEAKERRSNKQFFTFSPLLKLIFSLVSTPWITRRVLGCVSFFRLDPFTVFVVGIKHPYRLFFLGLLSSVNRLKRILQHCATLMRHIRSFFHSLVVNITLALRQICRIAVIFLYKNTFTAHQETVNLSVYNLLCTVNTCTSFIHFLSYIRRVSRLVHKLCHNQVLFWSQFSNNKRCSFWPVCILHQSVFFLQYSTTIQK